MDDGLGSPLKPEHAELAADAFARWAQSEGLLARIDGELAADLAKAYMAGFAGGVGAGWADGRLGLAGPHDWQAMFVKYAGIVGRNEGTDFLYEDEWTPEEWAAINSLEAPGPGRGWRPGQR